MSIDGPKENTTPDAAVAERATPVSTSRETSKDRFGSPNDSSDYSAENDFDRKKRRKSRGLGDPVFCRPLEVVVKDDRVEQAIRQLKNRMAREGVLRELKNRRHYFKPSELKRIKSREAARRRRKQARQKGPN